MGSYHSPSRGDHVKKLPSGRSRPRYLSIRSRLFCGVDLDLDLDFLAPGVLEDLDEGVALFFLGVLACCFLGAACSSMARRESLWLFLPAFDRAVLLLLALSSSPASATAAATGGRGGGGVTTVVAVVGTSPPSLLLAASSIIILLSLSLSLYRMPCALE